MEQRDASLHEAFVLYKKTEAQRDELDAKLEEAKKWANMYDVMGAEADEQEFQRRGCEIKELKATIAKLEEK